MTDTAPAFPPCSDCAEGNHGPCTRPFCGCNQAGHTLGPAVAPIGEVLDAATRAPASAEATAQAEVAAAPTPDAPVLPPPVDPMGMVDPAAVGDALATQLAPVLGDLPPDAELPLDVGTGQVGLADVTGELATTMPPEGEQFTTSSTEVTAPLPAEGGTLVMAAPRDPVLHVSIWDGPRHVHASEAPLDDAPEVPDEQAVIDAMEADLAATGNDGAPEHGYDGNPDAPYRCACGADPGSLNKLGSHLGIQGDAQAMADLGALTVPNVVSHKARERAAKEAEKTSPGTGEPMTAIEAPADGTPTTLDTTEPVNPAADPEFLAQLREAMAADPAMTDVLIEQNAAELAAQGALTPDPTAPIETTATETAPGMLPPLGPSDELDGPGLLGPTHGHVTEDELAATHPAPTPPPALTPDYWADRVRSELTGLLDEEDPAVMGPWRVLLVNGADGWVTEALYGGEPVHPAVADEILEHFGFDPTPLASLPTGTPEQLQQAVMAPTEQPPEMRSMSVLPATAPGAVTRVQVARLTTACAECTVPIEPGDLIGFKAGLGTVHANHGE